MLTMAKFIMNNAMNAFTGDTPFFLNYSNHLVTLNIQEFSSRLAQVNTPREGYKYYVTESATDQIPTVMKYIKHFQKTLKKAKWCFEQAQQRQKAYTNRHKHHVEYQEGE